MGKIKGIMFLAVFSLLFTSTVASANEIVQIRFRFVNTGSCFVIHGDMTNPLWDGIGDGALTLSGKADGEYYEQPETPLKGYMMDNLAAKGSLLIRWTEDENSRRWVSVTFYSTATSKGVYFDDPVVLGSISWASGNPNDYIRFKGTYFDGSENQKISGIALFMIIQISEEGYEAGVQLLSGPQPIEQNNMFLAAWLNAGTQEIPPAQVFMWNVEIGP